MDNVRSKFKKTNRSIVYHYLFSQALPGKPTLLFIHGFPSTSYDWHQQVNYFQPKGYGLVVPDLLGYGQTEPKPTNPAEFSRSAIAQDLLDILDEESAKDVIVISHDWGTTVANELSVAHSDRFLGFAYVAVPYRPPGASPPLKAVLEFQRQTFGRPLFGYWTLLLREDGASLIEANVESFLDILHPADPETWKTHMNPPGELEAFIQQSKRLPRASYVTPEHYEHIKTSLLQGGFESPLNWYKSTQLDVPSSAIPTISEEDAKIKKPAFMAVANYDYVCIRETAISMMEKYARGGLTMVEFDAGHWVFLEKPEEFDDALDQWVTIIYNKHAETSTFKL